MNTMLRSVYLDFIFRAREQVLQLTIIPSFIAWMLWFRIQADGSVLLILAGIGTAADVDKQAVDAFQTCLKVIVVFLLSSVSAPRG